MQVKTFRCEVCGAEVNHLWYTVNGVDMCELCFAGHTARRMYRHGYKLAEIQKALEHCRIYCSAAEIAEFIGETDVNYHE